MPSPTPKYSRTYHSGEDQIGDLKMMYSKGNGYEGRYDFPVTITKIVKDEEQND
jgi:hypothetical protein